MDTPAITNPETNTAAIVLTIQDGKKRVRKATVYFNAEDDWFPKAELSEVPGFFAGALMQLMQRDETTLVLQAKAFRIVNGIARKWQEFSPMVRHEGVLKFCFIKTDGEVEIL